MAIFEQLGRFLEHGSKVLEQVSELMNETREAMAIARPAVESLPALVFETKELVVETRATMRVLSPLLIDGARQSLRLLQAETEGREAGRG